MTNTTQKPVIHPTEKTTRTFDQIVNDVNMIKQAKAIREWLLEISGLFPRLNESPNPFYQGTTDGLTLVQYYSGPSSVGTPFGNWAATGGGVLRNRNWFDEAKERLGLTIIMEEFNNDMGTYGPVYGITLDLDGNKLPAVDYRFVRNNGLGIVSETAFNLELLPMGDLRNRLLPFTSDFAAELEGAYARNVLPDVIHSKMAYELMNQKWAAMKKQITFIDWMDEAKSTALKGA